MVIFRHPGWLLCIFLLFSCSETPKPVFRVATNVWPGYEPFFLARSLGMFEKSPIRLVEMPSASQVAHSLRNGTVEAAALTLDETLTLIQDGDVDLRVVLVTDISNGADVLLGHADIANIQELRGKRVGVENTATGAVVLDAVLQAAQLKASEITLVPITVNDHLAAWQNNMVDALVTFEPVRSVILKSGAVDLFNSSQIPGRIMDVLVVRADSIERNSSALKQLVKGYFSACDYLIRYPEDAAMRMAPRLGTEVQQVMPQFEGLLLPSLSENRKWLSPPEPTLDAVVKQLALLMKQHQLLQGDIQADGLPEARFLPEISQ